MEICRKCGNMMADDDRFCTKCGTENSLNQPQQLVIQPRINNANVINSVGKINVMKLIFEILALLCGITMLISMNMDLVEVNVEMNGNDYRDEISVIDAVNNTIDAVEDAIFEGFEVYGSSWFIFPALSLLIPVFAAVFALVICIGKIISLCNIRKNNNIEIGGVCTLLTIQFFYYMFAGVLALTEEDTMMYVTVANQECQTVMQAGWWLPTLLIIFTLGLGIVASFINNSEKRLIKDNIIGIIVGGVILVLSIILCFLSKVEVFELYNMEISNASIVVMLFRIGALLDNEVYELSQLIEAFSPMVCIMLIEVIILCANITSLKNGINGIIKNKINWIIGIIISIVNIIGVIMIKALVYKMDDSEISEIENWNMEVNGVVELYFWIGIALFVINIIYVIIRNIVSMNKNKY